MRDRVNKKRSEKFTTTSNKILQDSRLSYDSIGVFMYLWSMPDDWQIMVRQVMKHNNSTEYKVRQALRELRNYGYIKWKRLQGYCEYDMCEDGSYYCGDIQHDDTQHDDTQHDNIYIQNNNINKTITNINTASGFSQSENPVVNDSLITQNPTVKESLTVQKPKKEEEFEQFWLQWKDLCKNKGSQTGGKKPAKIEYEKVLKKVKQEDIIRVLNAFNNYIQIAFANNKHCERWIKSENWDNIDEAVADYKQQEENIKKQLIKEGKPVPLPQKTPLEAQKEVVDTNALLELRNAKYNALTQKQRDTSDSICNHLLTYFGEIHHEWIKSSIWFQQNLENDEIDLHIRIFSEDKKKVIELNYGKIMDTMKKLDGKTVKEIIIKVVKN